jgi:hypothetical protein
VPLLAKVMNFGGGNDASPLNDWTKHMNGLNKSVVAVAVFSALLTACTTHESPPVAASGRPESVGGTQQQLHFQLASGTYRCEAGEKLEIRRVERNSGQIELKWHGNSYALQRYDSTSGLPRYEDRQNGLLWIDLPWKSVLMDVKSGRPLANECKAASS